MRELHLSAKESTPTFFVLYDEDGVRFKLARSEMQPPGSTLHVVGAVSYTHLALPTNREV